MSLYISINSPSARHSKSSIDTAITRVAVQAATEKRSGSLPSGPMLDVTFLLPGENEKPGFNGMRMGGYTPDEDTLFFQTAVPDHILDSDDAERYVAMVMEDVIYNAGDFFRGSDIPFDQDLWLAAMDRLVHSPAEQQH